VKQGWSRRAAGLALAFACLTALTACGSGVEDAQNPDGAPAAPAATERSAPATPAAAPSWDEAAKLTYRGLDQAITLSDGSWKGVPHVEGGASAPRAGLLRDFQLSGDLDGDAADEAVVLLWTSAGGSGTFDYVAVLDRGDEGSAYNRATTPLGDRVKLRGAAIVDRTVVLETVEAGPGDAACCPGQKLRRTFVLEGDVMNETSTEDQGRLSLADIAGDWKLTQFGRDEAVPDGIEITLSVAGDAIGGRSACNRYSGGLVEGESPGDVTLAGPLASTRMMCPEPVMEWEGRYLRALEGLTKFSFLGGRLALSYRDGENFGALLFTRAEAD
jgi:heat shock protein HslJ